MSSTTTGRNDPCPCGSGRKYKHCCLLRETGPAGATLADIRQALSQQSFGSLEEVQAFATELMNRKNSAPRQEFHGLSPDQMTDLIYRPFDSPRSLRFAEVLALEPQAPILTLFRLLCDAIGDQGLKATAKGNLPRGFCRESARIYGESWPDADRFLALSDRVNREDDFYSLRVTRLVAKGAGLIRKYKGRFLLTRLCRDLLGRHGMAGIYPRLLRSHATWFSWEFGDGYPQFSLIQDSFAFTLYLLHRYGAEERPSSFYEDAFLQAFPLILREVEPNPYWEPEAMVRHSYTLRTLTRGTHFLGLTHSPSAATLRPEGTALIRKTALLDASVEFVLDSPQAPAPDSRSGPPKLRLV